MGVSDAKTVETRPGFSYENPLSYLPRKPVCEIPKGKVIYGGEKPAAKLYVVTLGRVKISRLSSEGRQSITRIVRADGLFGESCLIGIPRHGESAIALDKVVLMGWDRAEVEMRIEAEPRLGIALSQYLVRECMELQDRMEAMAIHKTPERVALGLLQLAIDIGNATGDGSTRVGRLTHDTIAEFVGTSREIVSCQMNRLRRLGLIRYSRKYLDVDSQAMLDELKRHQQRSVSGNAQVPE